MFFLRAHHILCFLGFVGLGYDNEFVDNLKNVYKKVYLKNEPVILIDKPDIVCTKCPKLNDGICEKEDIVKVFDKKVLDFFKRWVDTESAITPNKLYDILKNMSILEFEDICKNCSWYSFGYCKKGFLKLKKQGE